MVMVEDEQLRNNRLGLLKRIADFFGRIADFSFIGSTA
jgi:glycyl-tRNA synthetase beta subunit